MNIPKHIIAKQSQRVRDTFLYWEAYMEKEVEFWQISGDLDIHTQGHCERVLMHALRIGDARNVTDRQLVALAHASIFHDTRRKDNYLDTGHGARAAEYYKSKWSREERVESKEITVTSLQNSLSDISLYSPPSTLYSSVFLPEAYAAIWYHDRDDELGEKYIREHAGAEADSWLEVYHIFKDADALDRLRLGTWCLDPKFLRTREAMGMRDFAQKLVEETIPRNELEKTYKLTEPFRPSKSGTSS